MVNRLGRFIRLSW